MSHFAFCGLLVHRIGIPVPSGISISRAMGLKSASARAPGGAGRHRERRGDIYGFAPQPHSDAARRMSRHREGDVGSSSSLSRMICKPRRIGWSAFCIARSTTRRSTGCASSPKSRTTLAVKAPIETLWRSAAHLTREAKANPSETTAACATFSFEHVWTISSINTGASFFTSAKPMSESPRGRFEPWSCDPIRKCV